MPEARLLWSGWAKGAGLQEQITVRNYGVEPAVSVFSLRIGVDFADLLEAKEARTQRCWDETRRVEG